ncbi:MAG: hypothetical protein LUC41_09105 [Clostridiales bacterium]|nr:hypothetical protein [Clostridiales bacterium]
MANLKNVRVNTKTGEIEYYFPMELTPETEKDFRELIEHENYQVGMARLGCRTFKAVFIPVSEEEYHDLSREELHEQERARLDNRCIISDGHGRAITCPRQLPNPAYVEDGSEPKNLENRCTDCHQFQSFNRAGRSILFCDLSGYDRFGDPVDYEPEAPTGYLEAWKYEMLCEEYIDYVKMIKPRYAELAKLLTQGYSQVEACERLNKSDSTINSQVKVLRDLLEEFLQTVD